MEVGKTGNPSAVALNGTSIFIEWSAAENAAFYKIYRSLTTDGGYSEIAQVTECKYIAKELSTNTTYYFKVRGVGADGTLGQYSGAGGATTLAEAEQGFVTKAIMEDIADAIREKTKSAGTIFPVEMAALVRGIHTVPDGITEIEVVTCAGPGEFNLSIPCNLGAAPVGVVVYTPNIGVQTITAGLWLQDGHAIVWHNTNQADVGEGSLSLSGGVLRVNPCHLSATARFQKTAMYTCVVWR